MKPYEKRDTDVKGYIRVMEATRKHLLNLRKIIDNWEYLNIQKQRMEMLKALYKMLDTKELSISKLSTCEQIIIKLSKIYHKFLEKECKLDAKNNNQLNKCENKTKSSSEINMTWKTIDLKLDNMWKNSEYMDTLGNLDNFTHNYQIKSVDYDLKRKNEGVYKVKDATLPEFPNSLLQVNNLIGLAAIEKFGTAVESVSNNLSLHQQPQFIIPTVLSKSSTVPDKLNTDINAFHKIGSSNDPKQKLITPLKTDIPIDHTNSKVNRSPLLMESIRSVVSRDPRLMKTKRQIQEPQYQNYKEYREAKYGKGKYSNYSDKIDQKEKDGQCILNLENQKFKSSNLTDAKESTYSFGVKNSTDKIINYKIPKIKHKEEPIIQNVKNDVIETVKIKNNFRIDSLTDTNEDNAVKNTFAKEIITDSKIEKKLKTGKINDDDKKKSDSDKSREINLKKSVINIDNKYIKQIDKKQCHIIQESTRAKKRKKCSEEREVEKIIKEASSLKDGICGPKIRTRSSLKKIGEPLKEVVPNKKRLGLEIRERSKNIEHVENVNTEQDVILSKSKEESKKKKEVTLKLKEFLNAKDKKNIRDDEPKCKNVSLEEHSHFELNELNEKKRRKLNGNNTIVVNNSSNNQESNNALLNTCSDNGFIKETMVIENSNSGINFDHSSTSQDKVKLSKHTKSKENYKSFKIKDKNLPDKEFKDLKTVMTRCDKNNSFTDGNDQFKIRLNYEIISNEKANKTDCKPKNKKIKTNEIEEKDGPSVLAKPQKKDPINENPTLGISTLQDQYNTLDQSSEKMTTLQSNVNNTTVIKRTKPYINELEKLRLGAGQAYGSDDVLYEHRILKCRQNKKIDYGHTNNVVSPEKNKRSTIEQLDDKTKKSISNDKKSKTSKKQTKNKKKTIQVKTIKALTPEDFKDKLYFQTVDNKLECKLCSYNDIGLKIVRHYKEDHSVEEMLPSRLSVDTAEILINESVKENFGILNVLDLKPLSDVVLVNITLTCVFCYSIFYDITCFYDHITCHTGEYRYNCKVCKMTYPNVLELDKHISEHTNYDKSGGIFHLSQSNPVGSNTIFGYLCPFCYYIQLDYQRTLNHMIERHFNEDKKLNSYWTIIRVNMSIGDDKYTNSIVDYSNLVGCLPLILNDKVILKDENQTQKTGVSTIVVKNKQAMKNAGSSGIHLYNEVEVHLPKLNINSLVNKIRACNEKFTAITDDPTFEHKEYTLKYNLKKCIVAGLSCELMHSILVYKCSASKCEYNPFSTVVLNELFKHINLNHQLIVWDRKCDMCKQKVDNLNKQYLLKDALEHIISHHLVLKKSHQYKIISIGQDVQEKQKTSTLATVNSQEIGPIRIIPSPIVLDELSSTATIGQDVEEEQKPLILATVNSQEIGPIRIIPSPIVLDELSSTATIGQDVEEEQKPLILATVNSQEIGPIRIIPSPIVLDELSSTATIGQDVEEEQKPLILATVNSQEIGPIRIIPSPIVLDELSSTATIGQDVEEEQKPLILATVNSQEIGPIRIIPSPIVLDELSSTATIGQDVEEEQKPLILAIVNSQEIGPIRIIPSPIVLDELSSTATIGQDVEEEQKPLILATVNSQEIGPIRIIPSPIVLDELSSTATIGQDVEEEQKPLILATVNSQEIGPIRIIPSPIVLDELSSTATIGQDVEEEQKPLILATVNSQEIGPIRIIPSPIVLDELSSTATIGQDVEEEQKPLILATVNSQEIGPIRIIPSPIVLDELSSTATIGQDVEEEQKPLILATVNSQEIGPIRIIPSPIVLDELSSTATIDQDVHEEQTHSTSATVNSKDMEPIRVISLLKVRDDLFSTAIEQSNGIQASNDKILSVPPVSLQIQDVGSLKESKNCITNGNKKCYEIKYQYEVTSSRATLVGSNQQIVNKGVPINGTYCLIDTVYQKNYLKTFKEFGAKAIRSQQILNDMTTIPKLFTLFKCMDKSCTDVFSDKVMFELHIQSHFSNMGKNKKNQINNSEQFKHCVYCFKQFDDGESLATHILKNYSFCKYFCPFCFYRAYTPLHVLFHQNLFHNTKNSKVIQLENDNSEEILMAVDYNDFIMPYKCNVGLCTFSCYVPNDFIHHLNKKHPQCDKLCCHICGYQDYSKGLIAYNPSLLIEHFKDHHLNMYQCIFCLFGTETMDSMISHLAMEHFEYDSLCLERSVKSGSCDSSKVGNLNIIRMEALLYNDLLKMVNLPSGMISLSENLTERTHIKQSNNAITKSKNSANIEGNKQSSPAEVLQASEKVMEMSNSIELVNYNQMNILKDNQNHLQKKVTNEIVDPQESAKLQTVAENKNMISFSPDTIDNIPMTEFFPSVMGCSLCPNYTTRVRSILIRHLKAHQRNRGNTTKVIVNPVTSIGKSGHMFEKTTTQSASSVKRINTEKVEQAEVQQHPLALKLNKQNAKENVIVDGSSIDIKKKSMVKTESAKLQTVAENKNMISFSPNTIANIPKTEFFPSPMACSLCLKFTTRVRYILIRHLKAHQRNRDNTTKEIVNPLTTIRTSVNMCEKPTTQSASSCESMIPEKVERGVVQQPPIPIELNKQNAKENVIVDGRSIAIKNKSTVKTESAKLQPVAENKTMISFSPDTIDHIPNTEFFPSLMSCSLCPKFTTRVRYILIRHLKAHKRNQDNSTKEIVNSLNSIGTPMHMFEKPTTQSASSCESMNPKKVERAVVQQPAIALELNKQNAKGNVIVDGSSIAIKNKSTRKTLAQRFSH